MDPQSIYDVKTCLNKEEVGYEPPRITYSYYFTHTNGSYIGSTTFTVVAARQLALLDNWHSSVICSE